MSNMTNMSNMKTSIIYGVPQFIKKHIKIDPLGFTPKEKLYRKYREYCRTHNHIAHYKTSFGKALKLLINSSSELSICSPPPVVSGVFDIATTRRTIDGSRVWCWAGITYESEKEGEEASE